MPVVANLARRSAFDSNKQAINLQHRPMSVVNTNQPQSSQLCRATYIHVSDLTNAYNIDHVRLEEELARVKEELENPVQETKNRSESLGSVPTELDTSGAKRLHPPRGGYNMVVLVGKVRIVVNKHRVDGSRVRLAEVEVGDDTGTVSLRARDEQIDVLEEISKNSEAVVLRNCTLELYQGKYIRVAVTKWGKMSKYPDQIPSTPAPPTKINRDRNFSLINLSLVASEWVPQPQQQQYQRQLGPEFNASSHQGSPGSQSYQSGSQQSRRGRRSSRGGSQSVGSAIPMQGADVSGQFQPQHMQYPASGLVAGHHYYSMSRQHDTTPHQQHLMMHQYQFDSQQHQMHLYSGTTQQPEAPATMHPVSPIVGIQHARSFDGGSLSSGSAGHSMIPMRHGGGHHPTSPQINPLTNATPPPLSPGGMNADAASFDPNTQFRRMPSS